MKRDGRLKEKSEEFLPKEVDLVPQPTSLISPHVKSPEEAGDDCPVTVTGTQTSPPALNSCSLLEEALFIKHAKSSIFPTSVLSELCHPLLCIPLFPKWQKQEPA